MKRLLLQFPTALSLAEAAQEKLSETRDAAVNKVSNLRSQVDDLWAAAGEMLPRPKKALVQRLESALKAMRNRDTIGFPLQRKA